MPRYGHMLRLLSYSLSQSLTNALASMDLTSAQGHVMGYLAHCKEPPCPRDLEEQFQLSHPTVSGLLSRMEKKGFLELRPDDSDRRCKRIYILPKGWELHEVIHNTIDQMENQLVDGFSPEERLQFEDLLLRATRNMGSDLCQNKPKEETNE